MSEEILLNIMFTGSYLDDANIGHEIINLFKSDNGSNYIYVLPYGSMKKIHNDKIKTILLVKRCSSKILEIVAKATNVEQILYINNTLNKEQKSKHDEQVRYIDEHNITYGGLKPYEIFQKNDGNQKAMYITFKANTVLKAKKAIYISTDKANTGCYYMRDISKFPSQSPKMYISEETKGFTVLKEIIDNKANWENKNNTLFVSDTLNKKLVAQNKSYNFIDIIRKDYDELVFSNLFKYIFDSNPVGCCRFVRDVLGVNCDDEAFVIQRECDHIDLLLTNRNNAIVIENKIKSDINGRHDIGGNLIQSQLDKYHQIIKKKYKNNKRDFFIFAPDYNHIDLSKYKCSKYYKLIEYSKILNFFNKHKDLYKNTEYFNEFLHALSKHAKSIDSSHEEIMYKRFADTIKAIKES